MNAPVVVNAPYANNDPYASNANNAPYANNANAPYATNPANVAGMPSKGLHIALIVIGFLCGIIWGVIGVIQYKPMTTAMESGDVVTANKKANVIKIATGIGVVFNILAIIGMTAGQG